MKAGVAVMMIVVSSATGTGGCSCEGARAMPDAPAADVAADIAADVAIDVASDAPAGPRITYVKASNTDFGDLFGGDLAISADGNTIAIGAIGEGGGSPGINGNQSTNSHMYAGAVYVYVRSGSRWVQQAYLKASNPGAGYEFGGAIALSADGNTLAVASYGEHSAATGINGTQNDDNLTSAGAAYVFVRTAGVWTQQAYVKASNTGFYDTFGSSIALSADGNTLGVGASWEESAATGIDGDQLDNSAPLSGAVYVYTRSGSTWTQQAYVKASNTDSGDYFGAALSLSASGDVMAVGAIGEGSAIPGDQGDNSLNAAGAVYLFRRTGSVWAQEAYLKMPYPTTEDYFAQWLSLSADGETLAASTEWEDSAARGIGGNAQDDSAAESGAAFVFEHGAGGWSRAAYLKASNADAGDIFGRGLALSASGTLLIIGAPGESGAGTGFTGDPTSNAVMGAGAAYVFTRSGSSWSETKYLKASNATNGNGFGGAIGVSGNLSTLVIGAAGERSPATGIDGAESQVMDQFFAGAAYIFE